jgi:hypothetical protein
MTLHLTGPALRFFETSRSLQPAWHVNWGARRKGEAMVQWISWCFRIAPLVALPLVLAWEGVTVEAQEKADKTQPLAPNVVQAWSKAKASAGWSGKNRDGRLEFHPAPQGLTSAFPAFNFAEWKSGVINTLPVPETAFGLDLQLTSVTDSDLKELAGLRSLVVLNLYDTKVTDKGFKDLAGLKSLRALGLGRNKISGESLDELTALKFLRSLDLAITPLTDAGLKKLAGLAFLEELYVDHTSVTDKGMKELASLKSLYWISLDSTKISD